MSENIYVSWQNNMERSEFETKVKLGQRIESLERENVVLRTKVNDAGGQQRSDTSIIEVTAPNFLVRMDTCKYAHTLTHTHLQAMSTQNSS